MTKFLSGIFLSLFILSCGQKAIPLDPGKQRLENVCDSFMHAFSKAQFKDAINLIKQNSVIEPKKLDSLLITIENHSKYVFPSYGKMISAEFISEKMIKNFVENRFYILSFEKYPVKFKFTLYNGTSGWTITTFNYDEDLTELFD